MGDYSVWYHVINRSSYDLVWDKASSEKTLEYSDWHGDNPPPGRILANSDVWFSWRDNKGLGNTWRGSRGTAIYRAKRTTPQDTTELWEYHWYGTCPFSRSNAAHGPGVHMDYARGGHPVTFTATIDDNTTPTQKTSL